MNSATPEQRPRLEDRYTRWWDWFAALLLMAILAASSNRLAATVWDEHIDLVVSTTLWGGIAGLALGKSIFRRLTVFLMSVVFAALVIPWQIGRLFAVKMEWDARMVNLAERIGVVVRDSLARKDVLDNALFLLVMSVLFWLISLCVGYQLTRHAHIWRVVLPPGLAAFTIQAFDNVLDRRTWSLAVYLFLALVLVARIYFVRMRRKWETARAHVPPDVDWELGRAALGLSLALILIIWNFPSLSTAVGGFARLRTSVERPWIDFKDRMSFLFNSLRSSTGPTPTYYGDRHGLGRGIPLSDEVIFDIEAPAYPMVGGHYYWRARTYDTYQGRTWSTSQFETQPFNTATASRDVVFVNGRTPVTVRIKPFSYVGTLLLPAQPQWVSRNGNLLVTRNPDDTLDWVAVNAEPIVAPGEIYNAQASVASSTQSQLRNSGSDYPSWVLARYLQIPDEITARTQQLAQDITAAYSNPYDKAEAITRYLRNNIKYINVIEAPPADQEIIDWFLFDYRQGFCNYYATAEVLLLRAVGIPARWVVGYAQGEALPIEGLPTLPPVTSSVPEVLTSGIARYGVRQSDAHAWPEVYFPGIGWVEFEPTVSITAIVRPIDLASLGQVADEESRLRDLERNLPQEDNPTDLPQGTTTAEALALRQRRIRQLLILCGLVAAVIGMVFVRQARDTHSPLNRWRKRRSQAERVALPVQLERFLQRLGFGAPRFLRRWAAYAQQPPLSRAYQEINNALSRLGQPAALNATPAERAQSLASLLPESATQAQSLLSEYHAFSYSTHPANAWTALIMAQEIRRQSRRARLRNTVESWRSILSEIFEG